MKKYIFVLAAIVGLLSTSCEEEIDLKNPAALGLETYITDAASAQLAVNGVYSAMQTGFYTGEYSVSFQGLYADNFDHSGSFPTFTEFMVNNILAENINLNNYYRDHYRAIVRATNVINKVPTVASISSADKTNLTSEARALRAMAYFDLVRVFGAVPIVSQTQGLDDAEDFPRSSVADVYALIQADLAAANGNVTTTDLFRMNNNAIRVLKAKVHLYLGQYTQAQTELAPLIGTYSLVSNYSSLWANGSNSEAIFRINNNAEDGNNLAFFMLPSPQGRREVAPSTALVNAFEAGDQRINMIVNPTNISSRYLNKYTNVDGSDQPYVFRYADVLLMYAEVLARANNGTAVNFLNQVRNRAGLGNFTGTFDNTTVVNVISQARRVEFYGEGDRWNDVKRLGLAQSVITGKGLTYAARLDLWPIPQDEIDANDGITQADQNPGY